MANWFENYRRIFKVAVIICSLIAVIQLRYHKVTLDKIDSLKDTHQNSVPQNIYASVEGITRNTTLDKNESLAILPKCELEFQCKPSDDNISVKLLLTKTSFKEISAEHPDMKVGGSWRPPDCQSSWRVAIILPLRDREDDLSIFIRNIIPFLKRQKADFTLVAVEQIGDEIFNKAQSMDAGFVEVQKLGHYDCFIFHDVDMVPVNLCNVYRCDTKAVRHLGISRNVTHPYTVYGACIGGASAFTKPQFEKINGFTTVMFGWGGEDDDGYFRIQKEHMGLYKYPPKVGNYYEIPHKKFNDKHFPKAYRGLEAVNHCKYRKYDGLNTLTYKVINITRIPVLTRIRIQIPGPKTIEESGEFWRAKRILFEEMYERDKNMTLSNNTTNPAEI